MKRIGATCLSLFLTVLLVAQCFCAAAAEQPDPAVVSGCHSVDAAKALESQAQLLATAKAAVVYERTSGTMIYAWNADSRVYPASMVKLMTALVALEKGDLASKVVVTQGALAQMPAGALAMGLQEGEELTLEQLLYCMMVASSNDAAVVIAQYVGGSQERFLAMMNEKARELGCRDTNFSNVHGLHSEQTFTTARDVLRVLLAGLENSAFRDMFMTKTYTLPENSVHEARTISSTNYMMLQSSRDYYDARVTGGRTGATDAAGRCIAITAEANGMELVCVLMGAEPTYSEDGQSVLRFGSFEEMSELLDYAFDGYTFHQLAVQGQMLAQREVHNGANHVAIRPESSMSAVLPVDVQPESLRWDFQVETMTAPVKAGQGAGILQVWYGTVCLGQTQLVTANSVKVDSTLVMAQRPSELDDRGSWRTLLILVGIIAGAAAIAVLVTAAPKLIRKMKIRLIRRRRRKNRRRMR